MTNEVWVAFGAVLGSALAAYLAARRNKQDSSDDTRRAIEELKEHTRVQVGRANGVPWSFIENCPLPTWCKDVNGTMVWINNEYEQQWGIKSSLYEGRTDYDVWPPDVAAHFRRHDQLVIAQKRTLLTVEEVPDNVRDPDGTRRKWRIWKFPVLNNQGEVVAVGGIAAIVNLGDLPNSMPLVVDDPSEELWLSEPLKNNTS